MFRLRRLRRLVLVPALHDTCPLASVRYALSVNKLLSLSLSLYVISLVRKLHWNLSVFCVCLCRCLLCLSGSRDRHKRQIPAESTYAKYL